MSGATLNGIPFPTDAETMQMEMMKQLVELMKRVADTLERIEKTLSKMEGEK